MIVESMSEEEIPQIANPIMDNLMDVSTAIDHERHMRDCAERMRAIVIKKYLQKVCEKYQQETAYFSKGESVAVFKRPGGAAVIWKPWFTKAPSEFVARCSSLKTTAHSKSITQWCSDTMSANSFGHLKEHKVPGFLHSQQTSGPPTSISHG
jgi:hypothetical protein